MLIDDASVYSIDLQATDDISPALQHAGDSARTLLTQFGTLESDGSASLNTLASQAEASAARIKSAMAGITAPDVKSGGFDVLGQQANAAATEVETAMERIRTSIMGIGNGAQSDLFIGLTDQADAAASLVQASMARIEASIGHISGLTGTGDPFVLMGEEARTAAGSVESAMARVDAAVHGSTAGGGEATGFATLSADADRAAQVVIVDMDAVVAAIDRAVAVVDEGFASLGGSIDTLTGSMDGLVGAVDGLASDFYREADGANAAAAANDRLATSQKAVRDSSGGAGLGTAMGGAGRTLATAGGAVDLLGLGSLWESGKYQAAFQAAGHNAMMSQADINAIQQQGMSLYTSNPVAYGDIATSYQRAGEQFQQKPGQSPQAYAAELTQIVKESLRSAVATNANTGDVAQLLSKVLFDFGLSGKDSQHAMDVTHAVGGEGGNLNIEDLSKYLARPAATGSELGASLPQIGGLFDVLSKQFGPEMTSTYLSGMFQKMLSQSKGSETMLSNIGMAGEWSQLGAEKYGPYKLLQDLQTHAAAYSEKTGGKTTVGDIINAIIPSTRGGQAYNALMQHGHLAMAENITQRLGGTVMGHDANPLGDGSHHGIYGVTTAQYNAQMKTTAAQAKVLENQLKGLAMTIGATVAPVFAKIAAAVGPIIAAFGRWISTHKDLVRSFSEVAIAATAIGGALVALGALAGAAGLATLGGILGGIAISSGKLGGLGDAIKNFVDGFTGVNTAADEAGRLRENMANLTGYTSPMQQFGAAVHGAFDSLGSVIHDVASFFGQVGSAMAPLIQQDMPTFRSTLEFVSKDLSLLGSDLGGLFKQLGVFQGGTKGSADGAKQLADVLNFVLVASFQSLMTIIDAAIIVVDAIVVAVRLFTTVVQGIAGFLNAASQVIENFFSGFGSVAHSTLDAVGSAIGTFFSQFGSTAKHGLDTVTTDVGSFFSGLGSALSTFVSSWLSTVTGWGSSFLSDVGTGLKAVASAILSWFGTEVTHFKTAGGDFIIGLVHGIESDADKIKNALVAAVQAAITAGENLVTNAAGGFWSGLTSHIPGFGSSGSVSGPNTAGGGGYTHGSNYGPYGGASANYLSTGDEAMLGSLGVSYSGGTMDTDFPAAGGTPYRLPPGAAYTLVSQGTDPNVGGYEVWKNQANGGTLMFLHGEPINGKNPSPFATGSTEQGGTYVGKSGHALTDVYGNNKNFYHLCVVTDNGEMAWLNNDQMAAAASNTKGRGGGGPVTAGGSVTGAVSAAGVPLLPNASALTLQLAAQTQHGQVPVPSFGAAQANMTAINSTVIPQLYQEIKALPPTLQTTFLPGLETIAATWSKDQQAYLQGVQKENASYAAKVQQIRSGATQAEDSILTRAGIRTDASNQAQLARANAAEATYDQRRAALVAKEATDRTSGTQAENTARDSYLQRRGVLEKELQDADTSKRKQSIQTEISSLDASHARAAGSRTAAEDRRESNDRANVSRLDASNKTHLAETDRILGIHNSEQAALLNASIQSRKTSEADALAKAKAVHEANLANLQHILEKSDGSLQATLNKFQATLAKGITPAKEWDAITGAISTSVTNLTKTLDMQRLHPSIGAALIPLTPAQRQQSMIEQQNGGPAIAAETQQQQTIQQLTVAYQKQQQITNATNQAQMLLDMHTGQFSAALQLITTRVSTGLGNALAKTTLDIQQHGAATAADSAALARWATDQARISQSQTAAAALEQQATDTANRALGLFGSSIQTTSTLLSGTLTNAENQYAYDLINHTGNLTADTSAIRSDSIAVNSNADAMTKAAAIATAAGLDQYDAATSVADATYKEATAAYENAVISGVTGSALLVLQNAAIAAGVALGQIQNIANTITSAVSAKLSALTNPASSAAASTTAPSFSAVPYPSGGSGFGATVPTVSVPTVSTPSLASGSVTPSTTTSATSYQSQWNAGYNDYVIGKAPIENPYASGTPEASAWTDGWQAAQSALGSTVPSIASGTGGSTATTGTVGTGTFGNVGAIAATGSLGSGETWTGMPTTTSTTAPATSTTSGTTTSTGTNGGVAGHAIYASTWVGGKLHQVQIGWSGGSAGYVAEGASNFNPPSGVKPYGGETVTMMRMPDGSLQAYTTINGQSVPVTNTGQPILSASQLTSTYNGQTTTQTPAQYFESQANVKAAELSQFYQTYTAMNTAQRLVSNGTITAAQAALVTPGMTSDQMDAVLGLSGPTSLGNGWYVTGAGTFQQPGYSPSGQGQITQEQWAFPSSIYPSDGSQSANLGAMSWINPGGSFDLGNGALVTGASGSRSLWGAASGYGNVGAIQANQTNPQLTQISQQLGQLVNSSATTATNTGANTQSAVNLAQYVQYVMTNLQQLVNLERTSGNRGIGRVQDVGAGMNQLGAIGLANLAAGI